MFPFFVNFIRISCVSVLQVLALHFLLAEHISAEFNALMAQTTTFALVDLMNYIQRNWLRSRVWTTDSWSVYNQSVRTNNDVEGWHHRINHRSNGTAPPLYVGALAVHGSPTCTNNFAIRLREEAQALPVKMLPTAARRNLRVVGQVRS